MNACKSWSEILACEESDTLRKALQKYWGYDSFRPLQRESMLSAMEGRDSLTVLPTGGGKSLCYQAPAVCRDGMAIVVSPLIALMKDQVDALTECGIPAAFINSTLTPDERRDVASRIRNGELRMLFAAPERLVQQRTLDFLANLETDISFIAIDEAHCISKWGHDFRPEYRQMGTLRKTFPRASIHAFTATATQKVRDDIVAQLGLKNAEVLVGSFDRPNLLYRVERRSDATAQIREVIDRHPKESGIVYCISRANVESVAATLNAAGYKALPYHAGLDPEIRIKHQEAFIEEKVDIVVATVAFGMGIDKSNVRYVIHSEMPASIEAYQQESGRAGRDGLEAECALIYSGRDVSTWDFLINQSDNAENRRVSLQALAKMEAFCFSHICRHQQLVRHFGQTLDKQKCGACDVCLNEIESIKDALVTAQKIISSVYRQEQRFGAEYTSQVLRGSRNKRILHNKHDKLSTYGLLKDETEQVVRGWIDQLLAQGYLHRIGEHSVIAITDEGGEVLRGQTTPILTRPKVRSQTTTAAADNKWDGVDRGLFEDLRQLRIQIANERGVPPYVIFGDMTLRELARFRPTDVKQLLKVYGIGQQKLDEFGKQLVARIERYSTDHRLETNLGIFTKPRPKRKPKTSASPPPKSAASSPSPKKQRQKKQPPKVAQELSFEEYTPRPRSGSSSSMSDRYFELFDAGLSIDEVALQLDRGVGTVADQLTKYIRARNISDTDRWVLPEAARQIEAQIERLGPDQPKSVFEALKERVSYGEIKVVIAAMNVRKRA